MEGMRIGLQRGLFNSTQVGSALSLPTRQCEGLG